MHKINFYLRQQFSSMAEFWFMSMTMTTVVIIITTNIELKYMKMLTFLVL